ncbi:predicted protein [Sclerotinia sclerotiorum 1980 UF-70]|uniref:Uncharacterized protein n=1 Tax=Sclerotinia sclerotiorum (strain ATCC 18683 / 1980 / Ss-1) TaxID=665079 RepID=A7EUI8_SCLS1|nr:predicted protein [Sclerotinia sclerotiorum 1980 UF-70]EDN93130.1 predicted protein [Sclerotinia sclerotiorum 1980 UF-70]
MNNVKIDIFDYTPQDIKNPWPMNFHLALGGDFEGKIEVLVEVRDERIYQNFYKGKDFELMKNTPERNAKDPVIGDPENALMQVGQMLSFARLLRIIDIDINEEGEGDAMIMMKLGIVLSLLLLVVRRIRIKGSFL